MATTISYIAVSILQILIYIIYIREMLGLKRSMWWFPVCVAFAEVLSYLNVTFINDSAANSVLILFVYFVIVLFMAKGSIKKKTIMTITFVVLNALMELLIVGILVSTKVIDMKDIEVNTPMRNILLLLVQIAMFLGIQIPVHFRGIKSGDDITNRQSGLVFVNSLMCFFAVMIYGVYMSNTNDFSVSQVVVVCILVLLNFISYYFYNLSIESNKIRVENEVYKKQVELYTEWYEGIKSAREEARSIRHDMNNHISVLKSVAEGNDSAEIRLKEICKYIEGLNLKSETIHESDSGNLLIDAMLDMKKSYANAQNIEFIEDIKLPSDMQYNKQDFVIVFGNLIDNAIEGCLQNGGKVQNKIIVRMKYEHGIMRMLIKNTYNGSLDGQTGNTGENLVITTSKRDVRNHGIGLSNVGRIIKKYNGELIWTAKNREFTVNLLMFDFVKE